MRLQIENIPQAIRETKARLRLELPNYREVFREVEADMRRQVDAVVADRDAGRSVIPILSYKDVAAGSVPDEAVTAIRERGACVIRQTFDASVARAWDAELAGYVERNDLDAKLARAQPDKFFGSLKSAKPQIYGVYWSKPQVEARQSEELTNVRVFLNKLWRSTGAFDPSQVPAYADRIRRRPPGSASLGLSPHVDGGSIERWVDENYRSVYRHVFSGDWRKYDAFDGAFRPQVREILPDGVCSMFRTFQGWTALTQQGRGDGTLQIVPIANAMVYVLLRALQDDVADDELCGAKPGSVLAVNHQWCGLLTEALSSIPLMQPGDSVFWHCDLIHAVEDQHTGKGFSNVMYIPATVGCAKNTEYLNRQLPAFLKGATPPDFGADDLETDFIGRAQESDLTQLGRSQMGLS